MSRHEGVSCDACLKGNFRGRRYKCLTCYDYDLCATCYESGATTTRHTIDHPMQCILTHADFELYYGGEALLTEQQQSFTCPFCGKMGFSETSLQEHVNNEHPEHTNEVVCPICAAVPGGDPNLLTEDFHSHLANTHGNNNQRDLISFLDESNGSGTRSGVRRIGPHPSRNVATRGRRNNMHFNSAGGISSLSPSATRDNVDPIAELLSQLTTARRVNAIQAGTTSASMQLQQLQIQMHLDRQQGTRSQLERLPRRQAQIMSSANSLSNVIAGLNGTSAAAAANGPSGSGATSSSTRAATQAAAADNGSGTVMQAAVPQLILSKIMEYGPSEGEMQTFEIERADRSLFMKEVLLTVLTDKKKDSKMRGNRITPTRQSSNTTAGTVITPASPPIALAASGKRAPHNMITSSQIQRSSQKLQQNQPTMTPSPQARNNVQPVTVAPAPPISNRVVHSGNLVLVTTPAAAATAAEPISNIRKPLPIDPTNNQATSEPPTSH